MTGVSRSALVFCTAGLMFAGCSDDDPPGGDETTSVSTSGSPPASTGPESTATTMDSLPSTESTGSPNGTTAGTGSDATTSGGADETSGSGSTGGAACRRAPAQPSTIWISNASESTLSKINTETLVEEARYLTRADALGNPSRTSVNLNGDVAVANRSGGITVFAGNLADCPDPGNTSAGPNDVRPFPDGCMLWHREFDYASQRPVAWTQGQWNDETCRYEDTRLWTAGANDEIDVILLDGDSGDVVETVSIEGVSPSFYGIYGAAVDAEGNFWGTQLGSGWLVNVRLADYAVSTYQQPVSAYGMTVDENGKVWTCTSSAARFDPLTENWDVFEGVGGVGGCNVDGNGLLWMGAEPLVAIDTQTGAVERTITLPDYVHGVAVDFNGYVWGVAMYVDEAYRIDPDTGAFDTVVGLNYPYTYSDMTGFGLQAVSH